MAGFRERVTLGRSGLTVGPLGVAGGYGVEAAAIREAVDRGCTYLYDGNHKTKHGGLWNGTSFRHKKTGLLLQPLPPNSGILFGNVSSEEVAPAHLDYVQTTELATSLKRGMAIAKTIEHLMAVLHAYRVTNLMVKMIEEIPIMDGSALEFCKMIEEAGIEEQEERVDELVIDGRLEMVRNNKSLVIEPADVFSVHYFLDYPPPIGQQTMDFVMEGEEAFKAQVAPARTFGRLFS